jgi:hypothetical protein
MMVTRFQGMVYVNVFVAGQYNALLQSNSNFDLAVKKLATTILNQKSGI